MNQSEEVDRIIHDEGGLHRFVVIDPQCNPHDATAEGNGSKWLPNPFTSPEVQCRAFEDNSGALELACTPKM